MAHIRLTLLGGCSGHMERGDSFIVPARRTQALLAYLALPVGERHSRDKLTGVLWDELPRRRARGRLRQALFAIRQLLDRRGPPSVLIQGDTVALNPNVVSVDVADFEQLAVSREREKLKKAAALYRGDLLAGLAETASSFEEWLIAERVRLHELALAALTRLLTDEYATGMTADAIQTALKLLALDPLQEAVHRTLIQLYLRIGRRSDALRQFRFCAEVLRREVGTDPEAQTQELYRDIVQQPMHAREDSDHVRNVYSLSSGADGLTVAETPCIGRGRELTHVRGLLREALQGRGAVLGVFGEAGIGKSRLVMEALAGSYAVDATTLIGRCHESQRIVPFAPWVELLREGIATDRGAILAALPSPWKVSLSRLLPDVFQSDVALEPIEQFDVFESVARLLVGLATRRPLVLVLEDVHWADETTLRLLSFIGRRIRAWPALLIATARPEELIDARGLGLALEELERSGGLHELTLSPLSRQDAGRLATQLKAGLPAADPIQMEDRIWCLSAGNPFVIVETARALRQRISGSAGAFAVPDPVRRIIESRLQRLGENSQLLVATAAVIDQPFGFDLVGRAAMLTADETARALEDLVRRGVVREVGDAFVFVHDRVREVAYRQLLMPRRRLLHRQVAEAFEAVYAKTPEQYWAVLGTHYQEAGMWDDALRWFVRAGTKAREQTALPAAVELFERALDVVTHLRDAERIAETEVDLLLALDDALVPLGQIDAAFEHVRHAEGLVARLQDQRRQALVAVRLCDKLRFLAQYVRAIEFGELGLSIANALGDSGIADEAHFFLGMAHHVRGAYGAAIEYLSKTSSALKRTPVDLRPPRTYLPGLGRLAWALAEVGNFPAAYDHAQHAVRIAEHWSDQLALAHATLCLGIVHLEHEEPSSAIPVLECSVALSRAGKFAHILPHAATLLAVAHARAGRGAANNGDPLQAAIECDRSTTHRGLRGSRRAWLGEALAHAGRLDEASSKADEALTLARADGERAGEVRALQLLAELARQRDDPQAPRIAETMYRQALAIADALGARPLAARSEGGLAQIRA